MQNQTFKLNGRALLLGLIAAAYPVIGHAAPAARVDFATGNVQATGPNGQSRTVGKGTQIEQGETISTNNGRAQLRFTDGAYVSLQPESEFRIDQYRFDGKQDGNEKGFFSLIKGGLRTITGLVGRTNKNNYQVTTSVATIGIRGTEYTIQYGQSIVGTVGEGEINVCNGAGCLSVTNGESYYVQGQEIKPVLTNKRTDLPPPSPQNPPSSFAQAENVNQSGESCTLVPCGSARTISPANVALVARYDPDGFFSRLGTVEGTSAELSGGGLSSFDWPGYPPIATLTDPVTAGDDGIIAWGTASGVTGGEFTYFNPTSAFTTVHWVAGTTPDMGPLSTMLGTYTLLGATAPTSVDTGQGVGTLDSMSMTADFGTSSISGSMDWTLSGQSLSASFTGSVFGSRLFANGPTGSGSGSVSLQGFFAGANAVRAGITYSVSDFLVTNGQVIGAAALKQTNLFSGAR